MRKVKLNKKRQLQEHFNNLLLKRSNYLKNLKKNNVEGLKEVENEKVEILIDKCLGINTFERDYSFFNQPINGGQSSSKDKNNKKQFKVIPDLKVLIASPIEKIDPQRYKKKDVIYDNFANMYKNNNNYSQEKYRKNILYGSYGTINAKRKLIENDNDNDKYFNKLEKKIASSLLTDNGKNIINNSFDRQKLDISVNNRKVF